MTWEQYWTSVARWSISFILLVIAAMLVIAIAIFIYREVVKPFTLTSSEASALVHFLEDVGMPAREMNLDKHRQELLTSAVPKLRNLI